MLGQNGPADPGPLLRNAPFTTAFFPRVGDASDMHQQKEGNTLEDISVHGMVRALVHLCSISLYDDGVCTRLNRAGRS